MVIQVVLYLKQKLQDSVADFTLVDRMVIDSAGNVGIGTNDPKTNLHVNLDSTNSDSGLLVSNIRSANIATQVDLILEQGHDKNTWREPAPGTGGANPLIIFYQTWKMMEIVLITIKMNKTVTVTTFTGQHKNVVENKETNDCHELEGLIVSSIGNKYISYTEHGEILDNFIK